MWNNRPCKAPNFRSCENYSVDKIRRTDCAWMEELEGKQNNTFKWLCHTTSNGAYRAEPFTLGVCGKPNIS